MDQNKPNYIKFRLKDHEGKNVIPGGQLVLKDGDVFSAESIAYQRKSAKDALDAGKISEERYEKVVGRLKKVPDFVLGEIVYNFQVEDNATEERSTKSTKKASRDEDDGEEEAPKSSKRAAKSEEAEDNW